MNKTSKYANLIDHPLFANQKMQMILAERTAQAMKAMETARAQQPDADSAELLTNTIADLLRENRVLLSGKQLDAEIEHVVRLTQETMRRMNETEKNGREQLAKTLEAYGEDELKQLLAAQYQLYLHNVEKAKAADRATAGAAREESREKFLNNISEETRAHAAAIHPAIAAGADISLDKETVAKMVCEYTCVNNLYAMIYLTLDAAVVKQDGSVCSLKDCDPQESVYIPKMDKSFERYAVMNAVLMNLRRNESALNEREDFTAPDRHIPKEISDEDLCYWFACKDRLIGGCCRFAAGDGGALGYMLNLLAGCAAVLVVVVGIAMMANLLASPAVVQAICTGLTKSGLLSLFGAEAVKSSVLGLLSSLGIADNVLGIGLVLTGCMSIDKAAEKLEKDYPLSYRETQQAHNLRKMFVKRKAVDVNDSLRRLYAETDASVEAAATVDEMHEDEPLRCEEQEEQNEAEHSSERELAFE